MSAVFAAFSCCAEVAGRHHWRYSGYVRVAIQVCWHSSQALFGHICPLLHPLKLQAQLCASTYTVALYEVIWYWWKPISASKHSTAIITRVLRYLSGSEAFSGRWMFVLGSGLLMYFANYISNLCSLHSMSRTPKNHEFRIVRNNQSSLCFLT